MAVIAPSQRGLRGLGRAGQAATSAPGVSPETSRWQFESSSFATAITVTTARPCPTRRHCAIIQVSSASGRRHTRPSPPRGGAGSEAACYASGRRPPCLDSEVQGLTVPATAVMPSAAAAATVTVTVGQAIMTSSGARAVTAGATSPCHDSLARPRSGPGRPRLAAGHSTADSETPIASDRLASTSSSCADSDDSLSAGASMAGWEAGPAAVTAVATVSGPQAGAQAATQPRRAGPSRRQGL